jgi:hypothetical protein
MFRRRGLRHTTASANNDPEGKGNPVPNGKQAGIHVGRVAVRASGSLRVGNADGLNAKYRKPLDRADGYGYSWRPAPLPLAEGGGLERGRLG